MVRKIRCRGSKVAGGRDSVPPKVAAQYQGHQNLDNKVAMFKHGGGGGGRLVVEKKEKLVVVWFLLRKEMFGIHRKKERYLERLIKGTEDI